jgi:hypothetical protein
VIFYLWFYIIINDTNRKEKIRNSGRELAEIYGLYFLKKVLEMHDGIVHIKHVPIIINLGDEYTIFNLSSFKNIISNINN